MTIRFRPLWNRCWKMIPALMLLGVMTGCAPVPAQARVGLDSFAPLVKKVLPAVVNIAVTETVSRDSAIQLPPELRGTPFEREFRNRFGNRREQVSGAGSGFVIDPSGIIVTNHHVVGHADQILVLFSDGSQLPARVIGFDELTDIAVIQVKASGRLPAVNWGDSKRMEVGDWILAAGNPFGLGGSVTAGIISARGREIGAGPFDDFLQLDAPINPGNSGGPTFNMDGDVVGVNTAIVTPTPADRPTPATSASASRSRVRSPAISSRNCGRRAGSIEAGLACPCRMSPPLRAARRAWRSRRWSVPDRLPGPACVPAIWCMR